MEIATHSVASGMLDFSDYQKMYDLTDADLKKSLLDFASGISRFATDIKTHRLHVTHLDGKTLPATLFSYAAHQFDLALCENFFALPHLSKEHCYTLLTELCRIASEVRIFPLSDAQGQMPVELGPIMLWLQQQNFGVEVRHVQSKNKKQDNAMLRIWEHECQL